MRRKIAIGTNVFLSDRLFDKLQVSKYTTGDILNIDMNKQKNCARLCQRKRKFDKRFDNYR